MVFYQISFTTTWDWKCLAPRAPALYRANGFLLCKAVVLLNPSSLLVLSISSKQFFKVGLQCLTCVNKICTSCQNTQFQTFGRAALSANWVYFNYTCKKCEVWMFVVFLFSIFRSHTLNHGRKEAGRQRAKQGCAEG